MNRRAALRLSGIYAMGTPLLSGMKVQFVETILWQTWIQKLEKQCHLEKIFKWFYPGTLPKAEIAGFSKATHTYYFYAQGQYCFTILEKTNPTVGLLELAVPVWKRQADGSWKKLTCLSLFELEALAKAAEGLAKQEEKNLEHCLLPYAGCKATDESFTTAQGALAIRSRIGRNGLQTFIEVRKEQHLIWQMAFKSEHQLTCQI